MAAARKGGRKRGEAEEEWAGVEVCFATMVEVSRARVDVCGRCYKEIKKAQYSRIDVRSRAFPREEEE